MKKIIYILIMSFSLITNFYLTNETFTISKKEPQELHDDNFNKSFYEITNIKLECIEKIHFEGYFKDGERYYGYLDKNKFKEVYDSINVQYTIETLDDIVVEGYYQFQNYSFMFNSKQKIWIEYKLNNELYEICIVLHEHYSNDKGAKEEIYSKGIKLFFWDDKLDLIDYYVSNESKDYIL